MKGLLKILFESVPGEEEYYKKYYPEYYPEYYQDHEPFEDIEIPLDPIVMLRRFEKIESRASRLPSTVVSEGTGKTLGIDNDLYQRSVDLFISSRQGGNESCLILDLALSIAEDFLDCYEAVVRGNAVEAAISAMQAGMNYTKVEQAHILDHASRFLGNMPQKGPENRAKKTVRAGTDHLESLWADGVRGKEALMEALVHKWLAEGRLTKPRLQERSIRARIDRHRDAFVRWIREKEFKTLTPAEKVERYRRRNRPQKV